MGRKECRTMQSMVDTITARAELAPFLQTTAYKSLTTALADLSTHGATQQTGTMGSRARRRDTARCGRRYAPSTSNRSSPPLGSACRRVRSWQRSGCRVRGCACNRCSPRRRRSSTRPTRTKRSSSPPASRRRFSAEIDAVDAEPARVARGRAQHGTRRNGATEGLTLTVQRAAQVIKIVDAQVKTLIGTNNGALLAEWRTATHVGRKPGVREWRCGPDRTGNETGSPALPPSVTHPPRRKRRRHRRQRYVVRAPEAERPLRCRSGLSRRVTTCLGSAPPKRATPGVSPQSHRQQQRAFRP